MNKSPDYVCGNLHIFSKIICCQKKAEIHKTGLLYQSNMVQTIPQMKENCMETGGQGSDKDHQQQDVAILI